MAIYLDHAATTPIHPEVRAAMLPFLDYQFGNPSSVHQFGREIRHALDRARASVAGGICGARGQLIFTSGGTEADNLAIVGVALARKEGGRNHIILSAIEHHAVLNLGEYVERLGFRVTFLPVDTTGKVQPDSLRSLLDDETAVVSVMFGNNEVGTIQPIVELALLAKEKGAYFHIDAVQALASESLDLQTLPVDMMTLSAHKINGPKGAGALYVAPHVNLWAQHIGGNQERGWRAGTENIPGIIGFGKAVELAVKNREQHRQETLACREAMIDEWKQAAIDFHINGHPTDFLPHILNVSFPGTGTESMLMNLDLAGIACASGSACTSGTLETSHVLQAMNLPEAITRSAIRFSFGMGNTPEQARKAARTVVSIVKRLRDESSGDR